MDLFLVPEDWPLGPLLLPLVAGAAERLELDQRLVRLTVAVDAIAMDDRA